MKELVFLLDGHEGNQEKNVEARHLEPGFVKYIFVV